MSENKFIKYPRYLFRKKLALDLIKNYVPKKTYFLDIGCGSGDFAFSLIKSNYMGHLIDFSKKAAKIIKNRIKEEKSKELKFSQIDFLKFKTNKKFGLITFFEVLEHIENDQDFLDKINFLLNSNGYIVFSVPARRKYWGIDDKLVGHFRRYEKAELINFLGKNNFQIIKFYSYGFPFLNLLKLIRIIFARREKNKILTRSKYELSQKSGLNFVKLPLISLISNKYVLYSFIQFSKLFNRFDLSEGYLCIAKKL
ncbi:MAG: class I SAM-dependent methyltransferase [Patescibacteria group bacterium]|nr:class I SAM-dependent methyltransferase [Patescibacteria group bacterium]